MDLQDVEFEKVPADETETSENKYLSSESYVSTVRRTPGKPLFICGLVLLLISITLFGITYLVYVKEAFSKPEPEPEPEITYTQAELDSAVSKAAEDARVEAEERVDSEYKEQIHEVAQISGGTGNYLRYLFPNDLVFTDGSRFIFEPFNKELKLSSIESSLFIKDEDTGLLHYTNVDGNVTSYIGIDVSTFQKKIDWEKVKAAGVDFAIIRCAFRGYGADGKLVEDNMFKSHMDGAKSVGINIGVYFYTQATSEDEAVEEANMALDLIKPYKINGPVVIDVEYAGDTARTKDLTNTERTDFIIAFCETVKNAGYRPMIYANMKYFVRMMEFERLEDYGKWYANYNELYDPAKITSIWAFNDPLYFPYEYDIWQYTDTGHIDGISGNVDLNVLFEKWW
ncbi:MAG: glycoside hydrolase family 25 protein [Lachnospiraceae bacterium]|nr:glycoside hydrolase family 25 protein [Lachnospiraceae bacterium]